MDQRETSGILAGIASSFIGGMATAVTRYAVADMDPVVVTLFRFGIAGLLLLPVALVLRKPWPARRDAWAAAALGIMFYGGFFVAFARALTYTTAARGALAIATLPAMTMLIAAALRREAVTPRKIAGVSMAFAGVALSLYAGLGTAPAQAGKGDLMMLAAMSSMALYTILSRPLIARSSALGYACFGMGTGALFMAAIVAGTAGLPCCWARQPSAWGSGSRRPTDGRTRLLNDEGALKARRRRPRDVNPNDRGSRSAGHSRDECRRACRGRRSRAR
ncbi:MAG: DMT family transporter [Rubrivivax sp.]